MLSVVTAAVEAVSQWTDKRTSISITSSHATLTDTMATTSTTTVRSTNEGPSSSSVTKTTTYETRSSSSYVAEAAAPSYRPTIAPRTFVIQRTSIGGLGSAPGGGGSVTRTVERSAQYGALQAGAPAGTEHWTLRLPPMTSCSKQQTAIDYLKIIKCSLKYDFPCNVIGMCPMGGRLQSSSTRSLSTRPSQLVRVYVRVRVRA